MPRYTPEHKAATRRRILDRSARRLKSDGVDGSGVATLMSDAGLTNGAFYAHFESKDALVEAVVAQELAAQTAAVEALSGSDAVGALVRGYLSPVHRDHPAEGCPSAALVDEIVRSSPRVREAYTAGLLTWADAVLGLLGRPVTDTSRQLVLAVFAGMVGTLQMARAVTDPELSDALLDQGARTALATLAGPTGDPS